MAAVFTLAAIAVRFLMEKVIQLSWLVRHRVRWLIKPTLFTEAD
jgi:hypothetical protein